MNRTVIAVLLAIMMAAVYPTTSFADTDDTDVYGDSVSSIDMSGIDEESAVTDELLVVVKDDASRGEISNMAQDAGASLEDVDDLNDGTKLAKIGIDSSDEAQAVAEDLISEDEVLFVQPNYVYTQDADQEVDISANDSMRILVNEKANEKKTLDQWYMTSAHSGSSKSFAGWKKLSESGEGVTVAVIDTGAKLDHPDLKDNIIRNKCVTFNNGRKGNFTGWDGAEDDSGHGTHVCGLIASNSNDNFGISGASNNRAKLIVIDAALKKSLGFTTQDVVLSIMYAVNSGADVINMSIGALCEDYIMAECIEWAFDKNVLSVCAAGNENSKLAEAPGDSAKAISVMAHDKKGNKAYFSNYGVEKDVSAPGLDIVSSWIDDTKKKGYVVYSVKSGTSMAAPVVSGLAALLKSEDPTLTARQLKNLIYTSSNSRSYSSMGFGRINAVNAINNVHSTARPDKVVLNRSSASIYPGEHFTLEYAVYPGTASAYADGVAFASTDPKVATVDKSGKVKAMKAGVATITAKCEGKTATCKIKVLDKRSRVKVANTMTVKGKNATVKYSKVKKKAQTIARSKVITISKAKGKVTYAKVSGSSRIKVDKKTGKITVKKNTGKGTYRARIRVTAAGDGKYASAKKYVKVTIRIK